MDVSVIICTYNRSHNLPNCIKKLAAQKNCDDFEWEVIIVDNNSSDNTKQVVDELIKQHSTINIRYMFEAEQGLSAARNRGIIDTSSKYLIFIDDDIRVVDEWLESIHSSFVQHDCDAVGGRIHVESPQLLPKWITPDMYGFLGHRDFGNKIFQMNGKDEFPFGGNMALSRRIIKKIGMFDTRMGRKGEGKKREELFKGEETDYFHRLVDAGGTLFYEPRAIVLHIILSRQLERKYFRTLHFNAGFQKAMLDDKSYNRTFLGIPVFLIPQTIRSILRYLKQVMTTGPEKAFRQQMIVGNYFGMLLGYYKKSRLN